MPTHHQSRTASKTHCAHRATERSPAQPSHALLAGLWVITRSSAPQKTVFHHHQCISEDFLCSLDGGPSCKKTVQGGTRRPILTQHFSKHRAPSGARCGQVADRHPNAGAMSHRSDIWCSSALPAAPRRYLNFSQVQLCASLTRSPLGLLPFKKKKNKKIHLQAFCSHSSFPPSSRLKFSCWPQEMDLFQPWSVHTTAASCEAPVQSPSPHWAFLLFQGHSFPGKSLSESLW